MNRYRLLVVGLAAVLPLVGCEWMKGHWNEKPKPKGNGEPLQPIQADQLVTYLNERAGRFQSITNADVRVVARNGGIPMTLRGTLYATQPRNFRMSGDGGAVGVKVDLGSNPEQFWVYAKIPTQDPMYVFASHNDFQNGRAKIPGGIPFEPDWVMQAFGMTTLPTSGPADPLDVGPATAKSRYSVRPDDKNRTYTLSWSATTPGGTAVVKEIVFDADTAVDPRPQVRQHVVRHTNGKVICVADVKQAKTHRTGGTDPRTGLPLAIQYPTHVVLKWVEQKFEMDMELTGGKINQPLTADENRRFFSRPEKADARPIDLAKYDFK